MNKHDKIKNLRPIDNFDEAINQAKSRGKIEASIKRNLLETLRSRIDEHNLIDDIVSGVVEEVQEGKYKNAIELLKIAKEPEKQEIDLATSTPKIVVASEADKELIKKIQNVKAD